jgi:hypothetical protein
MGSKRFIVALCVDERALLGEGLGHITESDNPPLHTHIYTHKKFMASSSSCTTCTWDYGQLPASPACQALEAATAAATLAQRGLQSTSILLHV